MFRKDSFQPVINISLTWETFEQYALWQLLNSKLFITYFLFRVIEKIEYMNELPLQFCMKELTIINIGRTSLL